MIYLLGVFIAFFLSLLIFTKKGRNQADIILGIWMIVIGIHIFGYYCFDSGFVYKYPTILWFNFPLPYIHGPLLFIYTLALSFPNRLSFKGIGIHFILPIFILCLYASFLFLSYSEQLKMMKNNGAGFETQILVASTLLNISGAFYFYITFKLLQRHQRQIKEQFSFQEKINLNWLKLLFYGMAIMWILIIFVQNDQLIFSTSTIFVVIMGYFGIKQVGIFTNQQEFEIVGEKDNFIESLIIEPLINQKKYAKSGLSDTAAKDLHLRLTQLMETEKLFIEPELNLTDLSARLDIHQNYLSQVINEIEGVNFYDYINTLRTEEFKRLMLLPESKKYTLIALAYDCGFNSKSAFNRFFKKSTGLSPSEYSKQIVQ